MDPAHYERVVKGDGIAMPQMPVFAWETEKSKRSGSEEDEREEREEEIEDDEEEEEQEETYEEVLNSLTREIQTLLRESIRRDVTEEGDFEVKISVTEIRANELHSEILAEYEVKQNRLAT